MDLNETGQETVQQMLEVVPKERVLKYLPLGNYKWRARIRILAIILSDIWESRSTFEVDTTDRQKPTLKVEAVINGRTEWRLVLSYKNFLGFLIVAFIRHTFIGDPVILQASNALGTQITRGLKDALGKISFSPGKWF